MVPVVIAAVLSFLVGSIPFAYLFVRRLKGIDVRTVGSRNAGATNAARQLGWKWGILILALDALKGCFAAGALPWLLQTRLLSEATRGLIALVTPEGAGLALGMCAFLGHCFSPFLRFRGGKGVATALGVYLVLAPKALLLAAGVALVILAITRIMSLASIVGAILLPIAILIFAWNLPQRPWVLFGVTVVLAALVVVRHRANIRRLLEGKENRI